MPSAIRPSARRRRPVRTAGRAGPRGDARAGPPHPGQEDRDDHPRLADDVFTDVGITQLDGVPPTSLAFLSGANRGTVDDPAQAKRHVADQLFEAFVYQPWAVLEFGGLRHCVETDHLDDDGYPRPVSPHDPGRAQAARLGIDAHRPVRGARLAR